MRFNGVEKSIAKLDKDILALKAAKKYLSNKEEIEDVQKELNLKRQELVNELYSEESISYIDFVDSVSDMLNKNLDRNEQKELLNIIKDCFGREYAEAGKIGNGLNAWLKRLNVKYTWVENNDEWNSLLLEDFGVFNNIILD